MKTERRCRDKPFLDDVAAYPEYTVLVQRQCWNHQLRCALHRHRTAGVFVLLACSIKLSGAKIPQGDGGGGLGGTMTEWGAFLEEGLSLHLLAAHFEGFHSAVACMLASTFASLLVYPLLHLLTAPDSTAAASGPTKNSTGTSPSRPRSPPPHEEKKTPVPWYSLFAVRAALALVPLLSFGWMVAVWGAGNCRWGLASGMWVGLLNACLTLKAVSFVQTEAEGEGAGAGEAADVRLVAGTVVAAETLAGSSPESGTVEDPVEGCGETDEGREDDKDVDGRVTTITATATTTSSGSIRTGANNILENGAVGVPNDDFPGRAGGDGGSTRTHQDGGKTSVSNICEGGIAARVAAAPAALDGRAENQQTGSPSLLLSFEEYAVFVLAVPSLVCEPRLLQRRRGAAARRPPDLARAFAEFLHAGLVFLALHAAYSAMFAPALRLMAATFDNRSSTRFYSTATTTTTTLSDGDVLAGSDWMDFPGWAATLLANRADGGVGQLLFSQGGRVGGGGGEEVSGKFLEIAAAVVTVVTMFFLSPFFRFVAFYGFWHCVCLGFAELCGYPDRDFYGPWWLLTDDPGVFFRLWSSPVHRWLSCCVYRPMLRFQARRDSIRHYNNDQSRSSSSCKSDQDDAVYCDGQKRSTALSLASDGPNGRGMKEETRDVCKAWRVLALTAAFLFSSVVHEAVMFVAMRGTFCPFESFCLVFAALVIAKWDAMYPVRSLILAEGGIGDVDRPTANEAASEDNNNDDHNHAQNNNHNNDHNSNNHNNCNSPNSNSPNGNGHKDNTTTNIAVRGNGERTRRMVGSEWRGWGAVAFFMGTSYPTGLVVDYLGWQWWRNTLMHPPHLHLTP